MSTSNRISIELKSIIISNSEGVSKEVVDFSHKFNSQSRSSVKVITRRRSRVIFMDVHDRKMLTD